MEAENNIETKPEAGRAKIPVHRLVMQTYNIFRNKTGKGHTQGSWTTVRDETAKGAFVKAVDIYKQKEENPDEYKVFFVAPCNDRYNNSKRHGWNRGQSFPCTA